VEIRRWAHRNAERLRPPRRHQVFGVWRNRRRRGRRAAGGWFDSGFVDGAIEGFLFTVCPVGYVPSVPFSMKDKTPILESLYNCLPAGRPGV
jgi:hypothetical protein